MENKENEEKKIPGMRSEQKDYVVELKYSEDAIAKKKIRFIAKKEDKSFEIEAEKLIELLTHYVSGEALSPAFVDTERITVVYVSRQLRCRLDKDMKAGEEFNIEYKHPYPLEFAIIEEGYKIAALDLEKNAVVVTPEILKQVKRDTPESSKNFVKKFYQSFKNLKLGGSS